MWQADTFDPMIIDWELGWAENLGFNSVRVFLHHLLWEQDCAGIPHADGTIPRDRRPAPHRRDVRAVRRRLGPVPASREAARPEARRAQLGMGPESRRQDPRRPQAARRAQGLRHGGPRRVQGRPPRPRLGPVQRAGQHQRIELRPTRAGRQARTGQGPPREDIRLGATGRSFAAADRRRLAGAICPIRSGSHRSTNTCSHSRI